MGHTSDPENGHDAARLCYITAVVYLGFVALCGCQVKSELLSFFPECDSDIAWI
jgi:hypothetical protein